MKYRGWKIILAMRRLILDSSLRLWKGMGIIDVWGFSLRQIGWIKNAKRYFSTRYVFDIRTGKQLYQYNRKQEIPALHAVIFLYLWVFRHNATRIFRHGKLQSQTVKRIYPGSEKTRQWILLSSSGHYESSEQKQVVRGACRVASQPFVFDTA